MADAKRILWTVIWLLLLIFISLWIASISAFIYIVVSIFTPCIPGLEPLKEIALKGLNFPHTCSLNAVNGETTVSI